MEGRIIMEKLQLRAGTGGSLQSEFTGTDFPVSEWSNQILAESLLESPIIETLSKQTGPNGSMLKRNNKKTFFAVSSATTLTNLWATGVTTVRSATYETPLDLTSLSIDPVEYRTFTPVANEVIEEMDGFGIENYVRTQLAHHGRRKNQWIAWDALDSTALDSDYDWGDGGESLSACDSNTAIDFGTGLTVDNLISGYSTLLGVGYVPNAIHVPPTEYADLFKESQFTNAAQYGTQNTAITEGIIPKFMGIDIILDMHIPQDDQNKDVCIMADWRYFLGMVVAKEQQIKYNYRYETGEHEFYIYVKGGAKVIQESAGIAYYT
jgi:hypothetical protein